MPKYLTIPEFCEFARISIRSFHLWRAQGLGPRVTKLGRRVVIETSAAQEWMSAHERAA
jgi:predicted DNA-binding transcriptional regulator AlpA